MRVRLRVLVALVGLSLPQARAGAQEIAPPPLTERAPVVLDGYLLFEVGEAGTWSAAQRAAAISASLRGAVAGGDATQLELAAHDGFPTLRMGAWHLLTVADSDVPMGVDAGEQAQRWQQIVEAALARAASERRPDYLAAAAVRIGAILVLAGLVHAFIGFARRRLPVHLAHAFGWPAHTALNAMPSWQIGIALAALALQVAVWGATLWWAAELLPQTRQWRWSATHLLQISLAAPLFRLGTRAVSSLDLLWVLAALAALWLAVGLLTRLISLRLQRATGATRGALQPVATLTRIGLIFIGTLVILQIAGLDLSSLALLASVLGVGIGFGLQSIANNFVSGLIISFERPVKPGDFVSLGELHGTVLRIGARSTVVRTQDRQSIIVPNSKLLESEVVNWSYGDPVTRLRIPISVANGSDIERVRDALLSAARTHPAVLDEPRPEVRFERFGENGLDFVLLVWSNDPPAQSLLRSDLNYQIESSLRRAGIELAGSETTLHVPTAELDAIFARMRGEMPVAPLRTPRPDISAAPRPSGWQPVDVEGLVERMRGPGGVAIADRRHHLSTYRACFVGSEAVDWLSRTCELGRDEAVRLGQSLLERGIFHHVLDEQPFRDGNFYYRFAADEAEGRRARIA
jgi:potassium efflux system protein